MVPIMRYFPMQALDFAFKDDFKQRLDYKKFEEFILWVFGEAFCGKISCMHRPCDRTVSLDYIAELFPVFLASLFTAVAFSKSRSP